LLRVAEHFERTDTGRQRRGNEDAFFARAPLFAVADGMGGAQAGEVASHLAVEVLEQGLPERGGSVEERLADRVAEANARINELSHSSEDRAGMGTTLTAAYVGEHELTLVHVGDSRAYRLRNGTFERLTDDHTLVEELVRQGKLTPQQADEHPQRSIITRALGPEAGVEADRQTIPARGDDVYLLCSDGLTSMVPEARVGEILRAAPALEEAGRALIDAANAAGGRDNITVILFRLEEVDSAHLATDGEQPTSAGQISVPSSEGGRPPGEDETRSPDGGPATTATAARRVPQPPRQVAPPHAPPERRRRRLPAALVAGTVLLVLVLAGFWFASQTVYFVGSSDDGFVTVYRGVPYELPAGLKLYHVNYESGVPTASLPPGQRRAITEHKLRSRDDAQDLVRQMETGQVGGS